MRKSCTPGGSPSVDTFPAFLKRVTETTLSITKVPKTFVLYGGETSTLKMREELRLRVFENMLFRRISGPKGAYSLANRTCNVTLVNQICVVKTGSRAPNEPLLNRSYGSAESRFFRRTQKDAQFKLGRRRGRILFVLLFASVLRIMAQWTEQESLQLMDVFCSVNSRNQ